MVTSDETHCVSLGQGYGQEGRLIVFWVSSGLNLTFIVVLEYITK